MFCEGSNFDGFSSSATGRTLCIIEEQVSTGWYGNYPPK